MRNLCAEMVRYGVTNADIQETLNCSEKTVKNKMDERTEFSITEAFKVRDKYFPGMRLEYLFATDNP